MEALMKPQQEKQAQRYTNNHIQPDNHAQAENDTQSPNNAQFGSPESETITAQDVSQAQMQEGAGSQTRQEEGQSFLTKMVNRVFTDRPLSQVEVISHLMGYPMEYSNTAAWTFLNVSRLYWCVFHQWTHLRCESGVDSDVNRHPLNENLVMHEEGQRIAIIDAYPFRGNVLKDLCLYDYASLVKIKAKSYNKGNVAWGHIPFSAHCPYSEDHIQVLRRPGERATVCFDGYLSMAMEHDEKSENFRRFAVQHLALFVPWQQFMDNSHGNINDIWDREKDRLPERIMFYVNNIQLLRRSAEDARRDAKQWGASATDQTPLTDDHGLDENEDDEDSEEVGTSQFRPGNIGDTVRFIDVLRDAIAPGQRTAGSSRLSAMLQELSRFEQAALGSTHNLQARKVIEPARRTVTISEHELERYALPSQSHIRSITSQQKAVSDEAQSIILGIQNSGSTNTAVDNDAAVEDVMSGFGEENVYFTPQGVTQSRRPATMRIRFGSSTSFVAAGKIISTEFTLNKKQFMAFISICRHLDLVCHKKEETSQLLQYLGGEGGTGKSQVIKAIIELFKRKDIPSKLLVTATSGSAAAQINGMTIDAACGLPLDDKGGEDISRTDTRMIDGPSVARWKEKFLIVIDEVSMLSTRKLYKVEQELRRLCDTQRDFGGIPIVLLCGDFHQFRPIGGRSLIISGEDLPWPHSKNPLTALSNMKGHELWKKFTTVIILDEQVRAAKDPQLQQLLQRIRQGIQDRSDVELVNSRCYRANAPIPWETNITVVTPLNKNRWSLNMEAIKAFCQDRGAPMRIFLSKHEWNEGEPTEEEAVMVLGHGDDSDTKMPGIFIFAPGMPIVVNINKYPGIKLVNGASYEAIDVIIDQAYPGYEVSKDTIIHFGPPAGIILKSDTTKDFRFVDMPPGTVLLKPMKMSMKRFFMGPWQKHKVSRTALPCTPGFACTDFKVQGRTLLQAALELRGHGITTISGESVPAKCCPYSLYVQLSRCQTLDNAMLLSPAREMDFVDNKVPEYMIKGEARLQELSQETIRRFQDWIYEVDVSS